MKNVALHLCLHSIPALYTYMIAKHRGGCAIQEFIFKFRIDTYDQLWPLKKELS